MSELYRKPLRVYFLLGALALWGMISGSGLSISLFPMSSQPKVSISIGYGSYSAQQFYDSVGKSLESSLQQIKVNSLPAIRLEASYNDRNASYMLQFDWGTDFDEAIKTVENKVTTQLASYENSIRNSISVSSWRENGGFFALSFYSPLRSLDELYQILEPTTTPLKSEIQDAADFGLYNPKNKEITIRLKPENLALYELSSVQVETALKDAIFSLNGGNFKVADKEYQVFLPKKAASAEALSQVRVSPVGKEPVFLKNIADITVGVSDESSMSFRTSGAESLILFASPKEGGNVKRMSDEIMRAIEKIKDQLPTDVQYKVLVNPSDFINNSITSVFKEVGIAALLAVFVLFIFIGSFRNVITAAIEIPLSLLMAFILMKFAGMNLNLISLGGLALSAGMNVDASVVVLENIFRHFEGKGKSLTYDQKARLIGEAVNEVKLPIIASTIASLVVFLPLIYTRGLTNSLLGDLAKAVVFSHGLSAVVALLLVPTIRLHLLSKGELSHSVSPFEKYIARIENFYEKSLRGFLRSFRLQLGIGLGILILLPSLLYFVVPRLSKEIIGKPESDWLIVGINLPTITNQKEKEAEFAALEQSLLKEFQDEVLYTFTRNGSWGGNVMLRLKDKSKIQSIQSRAEEIYKNTPTKFYYVIPWNPSELRIPEKEELRIELLGGSNSRRLQVAQDLEGALNADIYDTVYVNPSTAQQKSLVVYPVSSLTTQPEILSRFDFSHFLRTATDGIYVDNIVENGKDLPIYLRIAKEKVSSIENLTALPVGFEGKLIPLGALARFSIEQKEPAIYRENQQLMTVITTKLKKNNEIYAADRKAKANAAIEKMRTKLLSGDKKSQAQDPILVEAEPNKDLNDALKQLQRAVLISIVLIFLTMIFQLGDVVHSLLVLVAIPLGIIGVILSLWIFGSTLSLNSGLGTILLNGIAVANSIILVDFIRKRYANGLDAYEATVNASTARLRPILMTSLTSGLGMLPVALGFGEGGKTLQPLGIAVCGGLWFSTLLTLFLVPSLQFQYLRRKVRSPQAVLENAAASAAMMEHS